MGAKWYETEADGTTVAEAYETAKMAEAADWEGRDVFETGTILETRRFETIAPTDETPQAMCRRMRDERWGWKGSIAAAIQLTPTRWLFCSWARY